jgi:hypothetical protein
VGGTGPPGREIELRRHPDGALVWHGGAYGEYRVDPAGRDATCGRPEHDTVDWQRMVVGQVLPLSALLQGIEVLHASAAVLDGAAVALTGPSGAGKSTLLSALLARGAGFLADDVAALEPDGGAVRVHPGIAVVRLDDQGHALDIDVPPEPAPLGTVVFLEPVAAGAQPVAAELPAEDPRPLLAAAFNRTLLGAERFAMQLDVCARVAASARLVRVTVPRGGEPAVVLAALGL